MHTAEEQSAQHIYEHLAAKGIELDLSGTTIQLRDNVPVIRVQEASVWSVVEGAWLAHIWVEFWLNPAHPVSQLIDCSTGFGSNEEAALSTAAYAWCVTTAPPIFSLLATREVLDAAWVGPDDPLGVPGWLGYTGMNSIKGADRASIQHLLQYVQDRPILRQIAPALPQQLGKPVMNGIKLFYGVVNGAGYSSYYVNGERSAAGKQALKQLVWPPLSADYSFSQFTLLFAPA